MRKILLVVLITIISIACKKDNYPVPNVKVNTIVYLDLPREGTNPFIIKPGGQYGKFVGVNGIVIYELSPDEYYAYDLMCTYNHDDNSPHFIDIFEDGNPNLRCPKCHSKYNVIANGAVTEGPARLPLRQYQTHVRNNQLHITN